MPTKTGKNVGTCSEQTAHSLSIKLWHTEVLSQHPWDKYLWFINNTKAWCVHYVPKNN